MEIKVENDKTLSQALLAISNLAIQIKEKPYIVKIEPYKSKRTLSANSYFHVLVHKIAKVLKIGNDECKVKMNLEYGTPYKIDEHTLFAFKAPKGADVRPIVKYPKYMYSTTENGKELDIYTVYKETHTLTISEMNRLISGTVDEAKELGIETLDEIELKQMIENYEKSMGDNNGK